MNEPAQPDVQIVGYCRACGKALEESAVRRSQGTIFCEDHVPQETTYNQAAAGGASYTPAADSPYTSATPPPVPQSDVSPGLAAVLGLIPGVGAIYNGQYAKGFVHLFILGMLFTIVNSPGVNGLEPLFGLMIPGFWFYMAFEAYHTARRRRLGLPVDEFSSLVPTRGTQFPVIPVLLIVFGVIILLDNLGLFRIESILRYWPAAMIALGVYLLAARFKGGSGGGDQGGGDANG